MKTLVATVALLMAVLWHSYAAGRTLIVEGRPVVDLTSLIPVLLIAFASALYVNSWSSSRHRSDLSANSGLEAFIDHWGSRCLLLGCSAIVTLFMLSPFRFFEAGREDGLIEWLSATLCFLGGAIFLFVYFGSRERWLHGRSERMYVLGGGIVCLLIGLEEVSWFQRQLGAETPEFFEGNQQGELNFHNFATDVFENLYYSSAFVGFVLMPFFRNRITWFERLRLTKFVPGLAPFVAAAISCSYSYDMWMGIPNQIAFWLATFIVLDEARRADSAKVSLVLWACLILMVLSQLEYLVRGETFVRIWDVTEYREYLITVGIFLYALALLARMRDSASSSGTRVYVSGNELTVHRR